MWLFNLKIISESLYIDYPRKQNNLRVFAIKVSKKNPHAVAKSVTEIYRYVILKEENVSVKL